jgi:cobalt-zinc-cadmium efflux system membrane fusion protein
MRRLMLLLALAACAKQAEPQEPKSEGGSVVLSRQQMDAQQMRVEVAQEREVATALDAPGRVTFDDQKVAHVFLPVSGRIVKIDAQPGQHVKKGDPLAEIESPDAGTALADLGKAQAALAAAERDFKRQKELYEARAGAQRDFEQAQSAYEQAKAELARARARASAFKSSGQHFALRSPIDGDVIARNANPGQEVQGQYAVGTSPELFTIGTLDPIWVYADVFEVDLPRIRVGAPVAIKVVAYPDRTFAGRVDWISAALDPASRTARVRCTLRNVGKELLPEMYATVTIETPAKRALAIPRSAIVQIGEERVVFVQVGQTESGLLKFERRRIVVEETDSDPVPVKAGLKPGDAIVVSGALLMSGML